jgi:hypothetical protein
LSGWKSKFWQTMVDRDAETATQLMADQSIITGGQGASSIDKKTFCKDDDRREVATP